MISSVSEATLSYCHFDSSDKETVTKKTSQTQRLVGKRWSANEYLVLIEVVRKCPEGVRDWKKVAQKVSEVLGQRFIAYQCRVRWKYIRKRFSKEFRRIEESPEIAEKVWLAIIDRISCVHRRHSLGSAYADLKRWSHEACTYLKKIVEKWPVTEKVNWDEVAAQLYLIDGKTRTALQCETRWKSSQRWSYEEDRRLTEAVNKRFPMNQRKSWGVITEEMNATYEQQRTPSQYSERWKYINKRRKRYNKFPQVVYNRLKSDVDALFLKGSVTIKVDAQMPQIDLDLAQRDELAAVVLSGLKTGL